MELVEFGALTEHDWDEVLAGEHEPFGPVGARLQWRQKERHVGLRDSHQRLVAVAGAATVTVEFEDGKASEVVGLGGVIVTRRLRGRGLVSELLDRLLAVASEMGADRAMLFCRPELLALYERFGFVEITAPVWVDQPPGRIQIPMSAMWRPLREGVGWPAGPVEVRGLPF
jgi:predicted GNAT family N-acyltransferase